MMLHEKFLFDTVFAERRGSRAAADMASLTSPEDLRAARDEAYREGMAEGRRMAREEGEQEIARCLGEIARVAAAVAAGLDGERDKLAGEAAFLALAAARALAPALIAREPHGELMALFQECVAFLPRGALLTVRVPPDHLAEIAARLEETAAQSGCDGRILVLEAADLDAGDCRIEWAEGGIARHRRETEQSLVRVVERHYGALPTERDAAEPVREAAAVDEPSESGTPPAAVSADGDEE